MERDGERTHLDELLRGAIVLDAPYIRSQDETKIFVCRNTHLLREIEGALVGQFVVRRIACRPAPKREDRCIIDGIHEVERSVYAKLIWRF